MDNQSIHTETRYDDLVGAISVNFKENESLNTLAASLAGIDTEQYQPIAMRLYADKEIILTIYARDRKHPESHWDMTGKIPVKKFKVGISLQDLFSSFRQFDFTLLVDGYKVDDFDVSN